MSSPSQSDSNDLNTTLQQILQTHNQFILNQQNFQNNLSTINTKLHHLRSRLGPPGFQPPQNEIFHAPTTTIKLDIPRFDDTDPMGWIFKINQFFDFHLTPEDQRLRIAAFYMESEALTWFQWMFSNGQIISWPEFLHALESRFALSMYEDPKGALFKLCQTSTVKDYQTQFESLANRISGLPPQFYLSCFISGLKPEIRHEVHVLQPLTLTQNMVSLSPYCRILV